MTNEDIQKMLARLPFGQSYKLYRDIDGPGRGNSAIVLKEEWPEQGGKLVWLQGYKYPFKGSPYDEGVEKFRLVKQIITISLKSFNNRPTIIVLIILFLLPDFLTGRIKESIFRFYFDVISKTLMYRHLRKPERYCPCVRELYRVFDVLIEKEKKLWVKAVLALIRDIFCLFIEDDTAYHFRFQDIMAEAKKEELTASRKRMTKEIQRLFDLLIEREVWTDTFPVKNNRIINNWRMFKKLISQVLWIPFIRKRFREFVKELDFERLKPDEGDIYFDLLRQDYDFMGKELPERIEMRKKIEGDNWKNFEELANSFLEQYMTYKNKMKEAQKNA